MEYLFLGGCVHGTHHEITPDDRLVPMHAGRGTHWQCTSYLRTKIELGGAAVYVYVAEGTPPATALKLLVERRT